MAVVKKPAKPGADNMSKPPTRDGAVRLRLYVSGNAPNSLRAIANSRAICSGSSSYELEVVDMLDDPQGAVEDGIIVSPTLLRLSPLPVVRVIGDLSDTERVLQTLGAV